MPAPLRFASPARVVSELTSQSVPVCRSRSFRARKFRYSAISARPAACARRFASASANSQASSSSVIRLVSFSIRRSFDVIMPSRFVSPCMLIGQMRLTFLNQRTIAPATPTKSLLLLIATDSGKFFSQASKSARASLPDGLIGEMGLRMRPKLDSGGYSQGLLTGIQVFAEILGGRNNFTLADVDPQAENLAAKQQRPRVVRSARTEPTETPTPQTSESPAPQPKVQPTETPSPQVIPNATPAVVAASPESTQTTEPSVRPRVAQPSETPAVASPAPSAAPPEITSSAIATNSPSPRPSPEESPSAPTSPSVPVQISDNSVRPSRASTTDRRTNVTPPANPDDEKEEVELTLTKPVDQRIDLLKAFIAAHPQSVAVPRAFELIVAAHATLGDHKLKAGDTEGGLREFRLAISEAPPVMGDALFTEVIARIPMNLFLRGQRGPATEAAHRAEALAKLNP